MRAILFVDRDSLSYFGGDVKNVVTFQIPQTAVRDMEVINAEELADIFTKTIQGNKLQPADILILFSFRSYFQKEVLVAPLQKDLPKTAQPQTPPPPAPKEITIQIQEFNESVPFNRVLTQVFTQNKKTKIIAINKDYAYAIRDVLEAGGYKVEGIIPSYALYGDQQVTMSAQTAQQMLKHYNSLVQVSYPIHETEKQTLAEAEEAEFTEEKKQTNKRLFIMLGVFGFLMIVLAGMYFFYRRPAATSSQTVSPKLTGTVTRTPPSPTPIPASSSPVPTIAKDELTFQVLNGSGIPGQADRVQERLAEAGFQHIEIGNAPTQNADKTSVVFKQRVSRTHRDEILTMIKSLGLDVSTRENEDIESDVLVTIYQSPTEE